VSAHRWLGTTAVLAAVAWALWSASPAPTDLQAAVADPQALVDRSGADALVLLVVPVLAWACWAWGVLGLALTALSTAPGLLGRLGGALLTGVLPAGGRRAAAAVLGLGLSVAAPTVVPLVAPFVAVATAATTDDVAPPSGTSSVDWPVALDQPRIPDWPQDPGVAADGHVVLRGDCLWDIAADWLRRRETGPPPSAAEVQDAVRAWWQANADVIGPDPDLLLPGQVLRPPG
jgi:hypothetical protein